MLNGHRAVAPARASPGCYSLALYQLRDFTVSSRRRVRTSRRRTPAVDAGSNASTYW